MQAKTEWLEDPEIFRVNRLDAHSDHRYYTGNTETEQGRLSLKQSLNGTWAFRWSRNPSERPADFWQEGFDTSGFDRIQVPGHIELQGYDKIQYINTMYPWEGHAEIRPPRTDPEYNPVGSYVREFDLEERLRGKRICISFQGAEQAIYVWLNGSFVGYAEDSFTPSEFDLTPYVKECGNRLCTAVYKRSSAAWLEDQDFFCFSGIFRDVYLYAKPEYHVEDLWIQAGLSEDYRTGQLRIKCRLTSADKNLVTQKVSDLQEAGITLQYRLSDKEGDTVTEESFRDMAVSEDGYFVFPEKDLPDVKSWSAEAPDLYEVTISLRDREGRIVEEVPYQTGFRRFEIRDNVMLLNGRRILINGVNRHEWNPASGRAVTEADMMRDIAIFRKNKINAVRTSHYPNQSRWYELCDQYGIYVMDEANLESHGSWQKMGKCEPSWNVPGSLPEWRACVVDRAESMLERDKNHPSILWWSCGNESYAGECILAMSQYFHRKDSTRAVHYEGVFWNREYDHISDVESRMYASPAEVKEYLDGNPSKPFLLCEYMHGMGNSVGGMESYRKLCDQYPMFQGGFLWDYIDQALYREDSSGRRTLAYGGDFGDRPTDYAFCANGLVFADRTEKPAMQEVRYWYGREEEREAHRESNRKAVQEASVPGAEDIRGRKLRIIHGDVTLGIKGEDFHAIFSYQEHGLISLQYEGREWIYRPPMPTFWRASTENDMGSGFPARSSMWLAADQFPVCSACSVLRETEEEAVIRYTYETQTIPRTQVDLTYTVSASGQIEVHVLFHGKSGLPELPLFGVRFLLPDTAERIRWQGLSGETYPDRRQGAVFGIHESSPEVTPYLVPQECGNHMDTRWVQVWDRSRAGLQIGMIQDPFSFSALPYTAEELENARHGEELPKTGRTVLNILAKVRGVGGIDSWGSDVEEAYHITAEEDIEFRFRIGRGVKES